MHEISSAFLHFDPPYAGLIGGTILHGWLVAKPGHHFADLRAVAAGTTFPGVYGIPREDLAAFFKSGHRCLLAGFVITLTLPPGPYQVKLEGLTLAGQWEKLDTIAWTVTPAEAGPVKSTLSPVGAIERAEMLRLLLRCLGTSGCSPDEGASDLVLGTPGRHHLRHPHQPFHGHLDQPRLRTPAIFGRVPVSGWIYHESQPIKRVLATTDLLAVQTLKFGRATAYLAEQTQSSSLATHCGYDGFVDLPAQFAPPVSVRVYAELDDGSWHLGSVARFVATDAEAAKLPFAPYSPLMVWRARRALDRAIRDQGWPVPSDRAARSAAAQVAREYSLQAPRRLRPMPVPTRRPVAIAASASGHPIHLVTHNLSREGAPLFLLEYARHLSGKVGTRLVVTSGSEGPLRQDFEALGAQVQVVDVSSLLASKSKRAFQDALAALDSPVNLPRAGLVVANTLSSYWAVHLARRAGVPVLFYIHESTPPAAFFRGHITSAALAQVQAAFRLADRVSFLTGTSQRYFAGFSDQTNYCTTPGWIDVAAIDRFRAAHPRADLRARLGLAAGERLVVNIGTVCERKGQHMFARAVEFLRRTAPELTANTVFLMVGGRDTPFDRELADFLRNLAQPQLRIIPETAEVYAYYGAADLFVCSSYEESFPRVVLEAMAFDLPIVSTAVHGIPEMVRPEREALLAPAGDTFALASAMRRLLAESETGHQLARSARARVLAEFDSRVVLPRHATLIRSLEAPSA